MNPKNIQTAVLTIALGIFLSAFGFGQDEMTEVERSNLAGIGLPSGAHRINNSKIPAEIDQTLEKLIAEGGSKVRRGSTEVLVWTGSDLKMTGTKAIVGRLTSSFSSAGWQYEVSASENGITFFTLIKEHPIRAIIGFYGEADGTLLFALTELYAAVASTPTSNKANDAALGSVTDYSFTMPSGWTRSDSAGKIVLTSKDGEKSIAFLPPVDSSGDLERDADRILWQAFKGSEIWSGNGFTPDYGVFERGETVQGLEYFRAYRYAKPVGNDDPSLDERFDASILLVKLGAKVAVVVGRSPFQSDSHSDSAGTAIDLVLYDLKFKSVNKPYDLKSRLIGSWSTASSTVAIAYTFNANGTFNKGGAISFRTSHDATRDKVTTTSYGMTDRYSLAGNVITQTYKSTGETIRYKVRAFETKYDKDPWQQKLGFLPVADPDGGTIVFRRSS
jgi:hypothetical protein